VLTATGDDRSNTITATADAAGNILINGGAVSIDGGQPTVTNTTGIQASGGIGNDTISVDKSIGKIGAQLSGGDGNDSLNGGVGDDTLNGDAGNDTVVGGKGTDTANLGAGNDTFIWNPGDGNDTVDGGSGFDTLVFNGKFNDPGTANGGETFSIDPTKGANDSVVGATFNRTALGAGTIRLTDVERIQFEAQGQNADHVTINDLTGTGVQQVAIDLGGGLHGGVGDGQVDTVNIIPTNGNPITVADKNGVVTVSGLGYDVTLSNFEAGRDQLSINGQLVTVKNGQSVTVAAASSNNTGGTSTASDDSHATGLALLGQAMASSFVTTGDGHGATPIADQPSSHQPLLTHPHA
jgi:RTX calcium-binding nonapeptide repeat (4 copies)